MSIVKAELTYREIQLILKYAWIFDEQLKARLKRIKPNKSGIHRVSFDDFALQGIVSDLFHHMQDPKNRSLHGQLEEIITVLDTASR